MHSSWFTAFAGERYISSPQTLFVASRALASPDIAVKVFARERAVFASRPVDVMNVRRNALLV
jgi:hypothetical protein